MTRNANAPSLPEPSAARGGASSSALIEIRHAPSNPNGDERLVWSGRRSPSLPPSEKRPASHGVGARSSTRASTKAGLASPPARVSLIAKSTTRTSRARRRSERGGHCAAQQRRSKTAQEPPNAPREAHRKQRHLGDLTPDRHVQRADEAATHSTGRQESPSISSTARTRPSPSLTRRAVTSPYKRLDPSDPRVECELAV